MVGLLIIAFLAGLFIGRSHTPVSTTTNRPAADEPVPLDGRVLYAFSPGESLPDGGAMVIALPADRQIDAKITASGLGAADDEPGTETLRRLGGALAKTDDDGQFQLVVPRTGDYSILIVSQHANRPDDIEIALADSQVLDHYFDDPPTLIRQHRYALMKRRLSGAPQPLTQEFGLTDKR